jgi:hypothetical protein
MRYTRIEIEGEGERFATLSRKRGSEFIRVEIVLPGATKTHEVQANDEDDRWSMAEGLQETLDGFRGTRGDVQEYVRAINRLAD